MPIFLLGFMGSGKSTAGKKLAGKLNYQFLDLDQYIELKEGRTIPQIFADSGESYFRKLEQKCLNEVSGYAGTVIALGGGTPCFFDNMEKINKHGISVYLYLTPGLLCGRLRNAAKSRPLLKDKTTAQLRNYIRKTLRERSPWYRKADIVVPAYDLNINKLAETIRCHSLFKK